MPRIISEDDGVPRAKAVQLAERTPLVHVADQTLGVLLTRLDAAAPPPAAVGAIVGSFAAGTAGWTRLVVRFSRPGQTDGVTQSHAPVVIIL